MADTVTLTRDQWAAFQKREKEVDALNKEVKHLTGALARMPAGSVGKPSDVFGTPWIRQGEDVMGSRGFSCLKMFGVLTGQIDPSQAKVETGVATRLHKAVADQGDQGYTYWKPGVAVGQAGGKMLAPLSTSFMGPSVDREFQYEMKDLMSAGVGGADQGHMSWIAKRMVNSPDPTVRTKALSWLNELTGGALVAPPEQGELIELLRNKEALVNAGARTVPLPPQGRMKYPRQTAASTTYWVGESAPITESNIGTGEVTLQAKKLAVLIKAPNELIRFASPAAEALIRDDMTKSLALGLDLAGLQGSGSDTQPRGVINFQNINTVNSSAPGNNGDGLTGKDIYRMIAAVEESNAEFEGFIMRPKTLYKYYQLRTDAVSQGDAAGPFLFNLIREAQAGVPATLGGFPVTKSTQVSQVQSKGTANNLTYIVGGMWSDLLIGMFGAIEFAATTLGDTPFVNDQTWVRGILSADIAARHEAAFVYMPSLDVVNQ